MLFEAVLDLPLLNTGLVHSFVPEFEAFLDWNYNLLKRFSYVASRRGEEKTRVGEEHLRVEE